MNATITRIHESSAGTLLKQFSDKCHDNQVTDFIFFAREKNGATTSHWFGHDSSLRCLGMAQYMAHKIAGYIEGE